ncbi:hypothetical protein MNV49_002654 [Pseudohyphozyma bogoriensis]|nr:hypothetical protein MNV49_002654 [Pseudohyphozyma bogoriensis]
MDSSQFNEKLEDLATLLESLTTVDQKLAASKPILATLLAPGPLNIVQLSASELNTTLEREKRDREQAERVFRLLNKHGIAEQVVGGMSLPSTGRVPASFERLPCANVKPAEEFWCKKEGVKRCSACCLVSYCSKECQMKHWKTHKKDCQDDLRKDTWKPCWVKEDRPPAFVDMETTTGWQIHQDFGLSQHLWGNIPAMDILNLPKNESLSCSKDLSLAFVASGDLRNLVTTINALPADFNKKITIVLNDFSPVITSRNLALLLLLGKTPNAKDAAESALHVWYSAFNTEKSQLGAIELLSKFIMEDCSCSASVTGSTSVGASSRLIANLPASVLRYITSLMGSSSNYKLADASNEFSRIMLAPSRVDYRDRSLAPLKPSHRLSIFDFRRFGLVLPFGALNAHFNIPNRFLFSPTGEWLLNDSASPLEAWNIDSVLKAGASHGATEEDLFGSLYFFLSDELKEFHRRLNRFKIDIHLFNEDAGDLATKIKAKSYGELPRGTTFDRIEVSNIVDSNYLGFQQVLKKFEGMLKTENSHATLLASSLNWPAEQPDAEPSGAGERTVTELMRKLITSKRAPLLPRASKYDPQMMAIMQNLSTVYNNNPAFETYLKKKGVEATARRYGFVLKKQHSIMPHRLLVPIDKDPNTLPVFPSNESWYRHTAISGINFTERYIEFGSLITEA